MAGIGYRNVKIYTVHIYCTQARIWLLHLVGYCMWILLLKLPWKWWRARHPRLQLAMGKNLRHDSMIHIVLREGFLERFLGDHLQQKNCLENVNIIEILCVFIFIFFHVFFSGLSLALPQCRMKYFNFSMRELQTPRKTHRFASAKEYYYRELCHQCMRKRRRMAQLSYLVTWLLKFSLTHRIHVCMVYLPTWMLVFIYGKRR